MRSINEVLSEQWSKFHCAKCKSVNWVYVGHSDDDCTGVDPEGIRCHKCGEVYHYLDEYEIEMRKNENPDWEKDLDINEGQERPD